MYKSGLYQIGAGITQLGGGNNYSLLGYPVGFYTNTGLTDMNESVSRPILAVNEYLGGAPTPMYSIGSGDEPFILDDVKGGRNRDTKTSIIKKYERKNLRDKINAIKYPTLFDKDKLASATNDTLRGGDKSHMKKMKALLKDLEKHRDNKDGIDTIIKKHKSMLEGMGYKSHMKGAGFFDWVNSWLPDALGMVPVFGSVLKPVAAGVRDALYGMNETGAPQNVSIPFKTPPPLSTDIPKPTQPSVRINPYAKAGKGRGTGRIRRRT